MSQPTPKSANGNNGGKVPVMVKKPPPFPFLDMQGRALDLSDLGAWEEGDLVLANERSR